MGQKGERRYNVGLACKELYVLCSTYAQSELLVPYVPCGGGEKRGRYTLFPPPPTSNSTCNSRQEHTHTHGLSLSKFPPLDFPCWQKGKIARLYREKGRPQYFLNVDSEKRLLFGNSKRTELEIEIVQNYTSINVLYLRFCIFQRLGSTAASPTMSPR